MVLSYRYKCIFIHVNKAAGTSIENVLRSKPSMFRKHYMTAAMTKEFLGDEVWNDNFKFAIVRNPWDKMVSMYNYRRKIGFIKDSVTFDYFIRNLDSFAKGNSESEITRNSIRTGNQLDYCADSDGNIILDHIGMFENLKKEWKYICNKIGCRATLPHVKAAKAKGKPHYSKSYSDDSIEVIARRFSKDIEHFGYTFEDRR